MTNANTTLFNKTTQFELRRVIPISVVHLELTNIPFSLHCAESSTQICHLDMIGSDTVEFDPRAPTYERGPTENYVDVTMNVI